MNIQGIGLEVVVDVDGSNQKQVNCSRNSDGFLEILQSIEPMEEVDTLDLEGQCPLPIPLGCKPCDSAEKLLVSFGMETGVEPGEVEVRAAGNEVMKTVDQADGEIEDDKVDDSVLDLTQGQTEQIAPIISMGEPILSRIEIAGVKTQGKMPVTMEENMVPSKSESENTKLSIGEQDVVSSDSVNGDFRKEGKYDSTIAETHEKDRNPQGAVDGIKSPSKRVIDMNLEKNSSGADMPVAKFGGDEAVVEVTGKSQNGIAVTTKNLLSSRGLTRGEDHKKTGDPQSLDRKAMVKQNSIGADKEPDLAERRIDTGETSGKPGSIRYFPGNKDSFPRGLEKDTIAASSEKIRSASPSRGSVEKRLNDSLVFRDETRAEKQVFQPKLIDINQLATSRNELPSIDERSEIDKHELVRELSKSVESGIQGETSFVKVNLDPDKFGQMSIDLIKSPEGIRARITAEKDMIRNLLTDSTSEIAAIFEEKNMKLETMVIESKESSYSGKGDMSGNDNHHQGYFGGQGFNEGNRRRGYLKETPRVGVEGIERPSKTAIIEKERLYGNTNGNINLLV